MCSCLQCALGVVRLGAKSGAMRNEGYHGEEQSEQELQEQEHTAEAPLQMCSQSILGVWLLFWLWLSLTPVFGYATVTYSTLFLVMRLSLCWTHVPFTLDALDPSTSNARDPARCWCV